MRYNGMEVDEGFVRTIVLQTSIRFIGIQDVQMVLRVAEKVYEKTYPDNQIIEVTPFALNELREGRSGNSDSEHRTSWNDGFDYAVETLGLDIEKDCVQ